jgi:hypothetical protein
MMVFECGILQIFRSLSAGRTRIWRRCFDFDQLPISEGSRIIGIAERSNPKVRRPLDDSVLVAADNPLSHFIHTIHQQPYRLVVDGTAITGIVTWSDLLKLPVTVLAFSLVAQLELAMNARIKEKYGERTSWLDLLDEKEKKQISRRLRKLQQENLVLPELELADLGHKAKILRSLLSAKGEFEQDLRNMVSLRNDVAHAKDMIRSDADLKSFVERIETAEVWLEMLKGERAGTGGGEVKVNRAATKHR